MSQALRPRVKWARWVLGGIIVAALVATVALLLWPRPTAVDLAVVTQGPIAETVADQGFARVREAYVVAAPVAGRLERVELHVGDRVDAGRTLVGVIRPASVELLDPRARAQAQAAMAAAAAAVSAAAAQRDQRAAEARKLESDLARVATLAEKGYESRQALDAAEAGARAARAGVRAADAQLAVRRSELRVARAALLGPEAEGAGVMEVRSPASGYVTRVLQESARTVAAGAPLVEVSDRQGLEAATEFLSQDAVRIAEGMPAVIYDWGGPGELAAVVRRVEPQAFTKVSALGVEDGASAVQGARGGVGSARPRLPRLGAGDAAHRAQRPEDPARGAGPSGQRMGRVRRRRGAGAAEAHRDRGDHGSGSRSHTWRDARQAGDRIPVGPGPRRRAHSPPAADARGTPSFGNGRWR